MQSNLKLKTKKSEKRNERNERKNGKKEQLLTHLKSFGLRCKKKKHWGIENKIKKKGRKRKKKSNMSDHVVFTRHHFCCYTGVANNWRLYHRYCFTPQPIHLDMHLMYACMWWCLCLCMWSINCLHLHVSGSIALHCTVAINIKNSK